MTTSSPLPPRLERPLPSPGEAICLLVIVLFLFGASALLRQSTAAFQALTISIVVQLFPTVTYTALYGHDLRLTFRLAPLRPALVLLAVVVSLAAFIVLCDVTYFLQRWFPPPPQRVQDLERMVGEIVAGGWLGPLAIIAVLPALCEELLFRGFLLSALAGPIGAHAAVAVTAVLFGLMHGVLPHQIAMVLLGLLYGAATLRSGTILFTIVAHATNNSLVILCLKVPALNQVRWISGKEPVPTLPLLCSLVILAAGLLVLGDTRRTRET